MPTYAFRCSGCGQQFEEFVRTFGATAPCPACGSREVERRVSAPASPVGDRLRDKLAESRAKCGGRPGSSFG
jgi:putative FmdB family regulatory protein